MDSEIPQIGAPISLSAPQRPLRIGRGDKYYEVLYVGGVAQERRLGRRTNQDDARNSLILDNQRQEQKEEYPVLDAQDPPVSELNPQPSVRRRRSRQGLAVQPTPPLRRHRPGSIRSKESTPSLESSETSFSEEVTRDSSAQPSLYAVPEQDSEVYSDNAGPTIVTPKIPSKAAVPIYDKPRHIYPTLEQEPLSHTMNPDVSITNDDESSAQQRLSEDVLAPYTEEEAQLRSSRSQHGDEQLREEDSQDLRRQQQTEQYEQQQEQLAKQNRAALQRLEREEELKRQRQEFERQRQLEEERLQQLESLKEQEAEMLRQQQAELQRQQQAELQRQLQMELQRQQQAELRRQQEEELRRQQQEQELQKLQQAELQRRLQVELQKQQQQTELQRQQQAELQRQQESEMLRQQQAALQQQAELRARQAVELRKQQQAELLEQQSAEPIAASSSIEQNQTQPEMNLLRKTSQKSGRLQEERPEKSSLSTPASRPLHHDRTDVSPSRKAVTGDNSPRKERSKSPHSVRNAHSEPERTAPRFHSEHTLEDSRNKRTTPQEDDSRACSEIHTGHGNNTVTINGSFSMQSKAAAPTRAPVAHRETPNEPTLGTTSPESLVDWYENDENFLVGGDDDDHCEGAVKRKPSKIIRKIKGLFENKKSDETPSSTTTERKRSDQLEPPPSPREPTTPTKKSKLGQFFSFNKKDERRKASPPPPLLYAPACQGPEDIPDGMLAKVFRSQPTQGKDAEQPSTPKTAPPFPNFREWSPSTEDLSKVGTGKEKEFTKPSKYFVPKIPPFQSQVKTPQALRCDPSTGPPEGQLRDDLLAPEVTEARNSPYSLCRNRGSVKSSTPRRTSLAEDDVDEMYEQFFDQERSGLLSDPPKAAEGTPCHTFVRKPSKKAAAIPPELRAPIYQPLKDEAPVNPKHNVEDSETRKTQPAPPTREQAPPEPPLTEYIEIEEIIIEEEIIQEPSTPTENRSSIQELRPLFKKAWMLIDFMTQDLIDGVPKEAWGELRIFFMIMIGMLVLLYAQGMLRFTGNNPLASLRTLFRGFQILLGSAIQAGMAVHDAVDAMLTDASSKLVADTLKEI